MGLILAADNRKIQLLPNKIKIEKWKNIYMDKLFQKLDNILKQMSEEKIPISVVAKLVGTGLLAVGANYLLAKFLYPESQTFRRIKDEIENEKEEYISSVKSLKHRQSEQNLPKPKEEKWGSLKIFKQFQEQNDPLLQELKLMDSLLCSVQRVNNLIVDLNISNPETIPCVLINKGIKTMKDQPHLSTSALVNPGEFIVSQCIFRPGMTIDTDRKYLRAGPRGTQFFKPKQVRADIVCLGNVCPGMNTAIRELVYLLKRLYKVPSVMGVHNSFKGYYEHKITELTPQMVETVHHLGGCFLGVSKSEFNAEKIVNSLVQRRVNQLYLIGANKTLKACKKLYEEINRRKITVAICVILKGINRDVPIFDTCFGFETAVEESSRLLLCAYNLAKSHSNGVSLVKLPGMDSGFLACYAALSTINVNICLVPEFSYDLYGDDGVISYVCRRIKHKGSCTLVYSQGAMNSARDYYSKEKKKEEGSNFNSYDALNTFDIFLKEEIEKTLTKENLNPHHVAFFNGVELTRSVPTNSIDNKLCCQNAHASIYGLMCGYTNFASGHLANNTGMISVDQLIASESTTKLKEFDHAWQRLLAITGQPSFKNQGETPLSD